MLVSYDVEHDRLVITLNQSSTGVEVIDLLPGVQALITPPSNQVPKGFIRTAPAPFTPRHINAIIIEPASQILCGPDPIAIDHEGLQALLAKLRYIPPPKHTTGRAWPIPETGRHLRLSE